MKRIAMWFIRGYQRFISPALPASCRFYPTCSQYGYEALEKHGFFKGSILTAWRILRCQPFSKGGFDPVPETWPNFGKSPQPPRSSEIEA